MNKGKVILEGKKFELTLARLCQELIENYEDLEDTCIIGIQDKGTLFSDRIIEHFQVSELDHKAKYGKLDITFHRDDFRRGGELLSPSSTEIDFVLENKKIILIDDVLYTGRTIHSAMAALQQFGRPGSVELMVFVDRRFNRHLPIQANYIGITVDAINEAYVKVNWKEHNERDEIIFYE